MKLSKWIELTGYSNTQVSNLLDVSLAYITYLRQGKRTPSGALAKKIVELTEGAVSYDDLFSNGKDSKAA